MLKLSFVEKRMREAEKLQRDFRRDNALKEMLRSGESKIISIKLFKKKLKCSETGTDLWRTINE